MNSTGLKILSFHLLSSLFEPRLCSLDRRRRSLGSNLRADQPCIAAA
jgi:hypothetical protein